MTACRARGRRGRWRSSPRPRARARRREDPIALSGHVAQGVDLIPRNPHWLLEKDVLADAKGCERQLSMAIVPGRDHDSVDFLIREGFLPVSGRSLCAKLLCHPSGRGPAFRDHAPQYEISLRHKGWQQCPRCESARNQGFRIDSLAGHEIEKRCEIPVLGPPYEPDRVVEPPLFVTGS